jgi:hypothetical protein
MVSRTWIVIGTAVLGSLGLALTSFGASQTVSVQVEFVSATSISSKDSLSVHLSGKSVQSAHIAVTDFDGRSISTESDVQLSEDHSVTVADSHSQPTNTQVVVTYF